MKVFLIGNKIDLDDKRKVNKEDAEQYVKDNKLDYFVETSAKTGFNAKNVFIEAAKSLYIEHLRYKDRSSRPGSISSYRQNSLPTPKKEVKLGEDDNTQEKKEGCAC